MKLPATEAAYIRHVRFGLYVVARLIRKRQDDLAAAVEDSSQKLLKLGRAWDDAGLASQKGYAGRDAIVEDLEVCARRIRQLLAMHALGADKEVPYIAIFPEGIGDYVNVPVDEQAQRIELLIGRLEANLPVDDPVRLKFIPQLRSGLSAHATAVKALEALLNEETLAADRLQGGKELWRKLLQDTHAELCKRYDKKRADGFFPKA